MHLFFLCPFVRAAWFAHPWYLRTDLLTENHHSMQNIIHALLNMNHPHASIPNIFNFLWCIWKSRNDCLFARKCTFPHQVQLAAVAMAECNTVQEDPPDNSNYILQSHINRDNNLVLQQGCTIRSDLLISGAKIFADASFKCSKIPGLSNGSAATGIGVFLNFLQDNRSIQVQIQASAPLTSSPLQAEAQALLLAAKATQLLQIVQPTFLTDNLSLTKAAANMNVTADSTPWVIRESLADFYRTTQHLQLQVFHISREVNGIVHNVAHQVLSRSLEPVYSYFGSAHRNRTCHVISILSTLKLQGFVLHDVHCF